VLVIFLWAFALRFGIATLVFIENVYLPANMLAEIIVVVRPQDLTPQ
jgi:hypothetical protein